MPLTTQVAAEREVQDHEAILVILERVTHVADVGVVDLFENAALLDDVVDGLVGEGDDQLRESRHRRRGRTFCLMACDLLMYFSAYLTLLRLCSMMRTWSYARNEPGAVDREVQEQAHLAKRALTDGAAEIKVEEGRFGIEVDLLGAAVAHRPTGGARRRGSIRAPSTRGAGYKVVRARTRGVRKPVPRG
jgi:hypothetical protein